MLIAHIDEKGHVQSLEEHSLNVADYCFKTGSRLGIGHISLLVGLLHDAGKSDNKFQSYILNDKKRHVNHSSAGGKYIKLRFGKKQHRYNQILNEICQYVIYSHHGLFDIVEKYPDSPARYKMQERFDYDKNSDYSFNNDVVPFIKNLEKLSVEKYFMDLDKVYVIALDEISVIIEKINKMAHKNNNKKAAEESVLYYLHCFVRLCLSILKEGDIFDSANSFAEIKSSRVNNNDRLEIWKKGLASVEQQSNFFKKNINKNKLNKARTELSQQLAQAGRQIQKGIYKLEMPTGSGKTHAALRYAMNSAHKFNKQRIFYVTSYLSVLEQNARVLKETLSSIDESLILEHHSNMINEDFANSREDRRIQYFIDSWDAPIILTTMVQLFQTMFRGKADNIRRFHQLSDSILILDEVQSLPIKSLYNFNLMMNFLSEIMNVNIVLTTATQPTLDLENLTFPIQYSNFKESNQLTKLSENDAKIFKRTRAINFTENVISTNELVSMVSQDLHNYQTALIILNTKKAVKTLYDELKNVEAYKVYYLTTNQCAAHRLFLINQIREEMHNLYNGINSEKIIIVSTQLVEAGVDFDFDLVYRSLSGVDSLVQASGRCNRNSRHSMSDVKIIDYIEENIDSPVLNEIKEAATATKVAMKNHNIVENGQDFDLELIQENYYDKFYSENNRKMSYSLENGDTIVELLGINSKMRKTHKAVGDKKILAQSFQTAALNFNLIDQEAETVIVPLAINEELDNSNLLQALHAAIENYEFNKIKNLLRKLQPYTVQMYADSEVWNNSVISLMDDKVFILLEEYYDEQIGLNLDNLQSLIM